MNRAVFGAVALAMVASSGQAATTEVQFRSFNFLDSLAVDNAVFAGTPFDGSEGLVEFERPVRSPKPSPSRRSIPRWASWWEPP